VDAIRKRLSRDGLLCRYEASPGLTSGSEATFTLCSFWMVDALALGGRIDEAQELFASLTRHLNDVGLMSGDRPVFVHRRAARQLPTGFQPYGFDRLGRESQSGRAARC
jgi:hypothetical protein